MAFLTKQLLIAVTGAGLLFCATAMGDDRLVESVLPILEDRCFDCHAGGGEEGGVTFDFLVDAEHPEAGDPKLWQRVIGQIRTGLMPPRDVDPLEPAEKAELEQWILAGAFGHDPQHPDPGRVTIRRLNRIEYRNTVNDLLGVDYPTDVNFPPDDSGEGFDNVGDVLTLSPVLMEKYIKTAREVVTRAVPVVGHTAPVVVFGGNNFGVDEKRIRDGNLSLSFYESQTVSHEFETQHGQQEYRLGLDLLTAESYVENATDENRCRVTISLDGETLHQSEYGRDPWKRHPMKFPLKLDEGKHKIEISVEPLTDKPQDRKLKVQFRHLKLFGPLAAEFQSVLPKYAAIFPREVPQSNEQRQQYARELLEPFLFRAFRRPPDRRTLERICELAEQVWQEDGGTFEIGIRQAMIASLASPRFLFREEFAVSSTDDAQRFPLVDEFSLASRLSYFLWSTMPDKELLDLARDNQLRNNLDAQLQRMVADDRFNEFLRNFVGQWLRTRDVDKTQINASAVLLRENPDREIRKAWDSLLELRSPRELDEKGKQKRSKILKLLRPHFKKAKKYELNEKLRKAMRQETEMMFRHLIREHRDLIELIDCDYTFLNERLAGHYGIEGVKGTQMRKVDLPAGSLRGGLLGHGSMLAVTSNPERTSPVKRGLFLLENLLGMPTGAPPPDIPSLEESETGEDGKRISLREALAIHRENALCSSCHNRMDPLGLALEDFDPLGRARTWQEVDVSGELATGEAFETLAELKTILAQNHADSIYRCMAQKMLTYALGRGLEYYDVGSVDGIVARVKKQGGDASELIRAIVESAPFQRMRSGKDLDLSK